MSWRDRPRCDETPAWALLQAHAQHHFSAAAGGDAFDLRRVFADDARRFDDFSAPAPHIFADLSKNLLDRDARALLVQLARECRLPEHCAAMLAGAPVNGTEGRAALHPLLRLPDSGDGKRDASQIARSTSADRQEMLIFSERIRNGDAFKDVVHIGIGGSDLGPRLAVQALAPHTLECTGARGPRLHFVANMDGHELDGVLARGLDAARTLFVIASKSFGTAETLLNARSATAWLRAQGVRDVAPHLVAVTARPDVARAFGVGRCLQFADGVGGRYSLWSAIGLPLAIALGADGFRALLAGAHAMDRHFADAPLESNLPVQLGLLDVWYRNFLNASSRCVAPYHHGLRRLPAYLQQLEMESNGKSVDARGRPLAVASAPVIWGEPGTNAQHAFFQMLHQGSDLVPVEFIVVSQPAHALAGHHQALIANALAQSRALMLGQVHVQPHLRFAGNRPSTTLLLDELSPASLGALLALYEHRTFVAGSLWGLNSFDQWGVELGKRLATGIEAAWQHPTADASLDPSSAGLLARLRRH
ncbi:glucose-6-phosphate isomerase [Ottowia testudinis]|uniref:Glucose-6-phosphate isomerase n=1 Tax=Ottowia testudinis TaxID=2816950 RepID=A0A975CHE2_9BURK|nr:glucose-6-phosphate isomerase [Ottowia testudinis]QTD46240.1 glucose-6-phosphate isomerase [Ottowia testudinis]